MINDLALLDFERARVTFEGLQVLGALTVDLQGSDAAVEHVMNFGRSLFVTDLDGSELLLLSRRSLSVSVACVLCSLLLLGLSSLIGTCGNVCSGHGSR